MEDEKKENTAVEEEEQAPVEEVVNPEETPEETPEGEETKPEEVAEGEETPEEEEPTAAELKVQLEAKNAEIAKLKGEKSGEKDDDEIPEEQMESTGKTRDEFIDKTYPEMKKAFSGLSEKAVSISDDGKIVFNKEVVDQQFDLTMKSMETYFLSMLNDSVYPHVRNLGRMNINLQNEIKILNLRSENPKFQKFEKQVRKALATMPITERGKKDAVKDVFLKLLGGSSVKEAVPDVKKKAPVVVNRKQLRDLSAGAGGGKATKSATVTLTADQEQDRLEMEAENGPFPKELYAAKLKALQDKAKAAGKKIPLLLR